MKSHILWEIDVVHITHLLSFRKLQKQFAEVQVQVWFPKVAKVPFKQVQKTFRQTSRGRSTLKETVR